MDNAPTIPQIPTKPIHRTPSLPYFLLGIMAFILLALISSMGAMLGVRVELKRRGMDNLMAAPVCDRRVEVCQ